MTERRKKQCRKKEMQEKKNDKNAVRKEMKKKE